MDQNTPEPAEVLNPFPVYLFEQEGDLPTEGTYYVVARDGFYINTQTKFGSALVKVPTLNFLKSLQPDIRLSLPKIPARIVGQALHFLRKVYKKYGSEGYLTLYYAEQTQEYRLWCVKQSGNGSRVDYERQDQIPFEERTGAVGGVSWNMIGTIHSHPNFSAFHSGTDTHDESDFDGIHITLGNINQPQFSVAASVAVSGNRERLDPVNCMAGIEPVGSSRYSQQRHMGFSTSWNTSTFYQLILDEADVQGLVEDDKVIEETWMPKVSGQEVRSRRSFFFGGEDFGEGCLPSAEQAKGQHRRRPIRVPVKESSETTAAGGASGEESGEEAAASGGKKESPTLIQCPDLPQNDPGNPHAQLSYFILKTLWEYMPGQLVSGAWLRTTLIPHIDEIALEDIQKVLTELEEKGHVSSHPEKPSNVVYTSKYYWLTTATRSRMTK